MKKYTTESYQDKSLKNYPHRKRLNAIYRILEEENIAQIDNLSYADFGCASGYITDLVSRRLNPETVYGFCHSDDIDIGIEKYPHIQFGHFELNETGEVGPFSFCTCFETLEHVGDIYMAIDNLCCAARDGTLLISVPIEIGIRGLFKFLVKTWFFDYNLDELPGDKMYYKYLMSLLSYRDMSKFRDSRFGWGTHFGFDYRVIDQHLKTSGIKYRAFNKVTTRYYLVSP